MKLSSKSVTALTLLALAAAGAAAGCSGFRNTGSSGEARSGACSSALEQRVRQELTAIGDAKLVRAGAIDLAFPADESQYNALDGMAILAVTVFSQRREELPVDAVYVAERQAEGQKPIVSILPAFSGAPQVRELDAADPESRLGRFRQDSFHFVPMRALWSKGEIGVRLGDRFTTLPLARLPAGIEHPGFVRGAPGGESVPDLRLAAAIVEREYCVSLHLL